MPVYFCHDVKAVSPCIPAPIRANMVHVLHLTQGSIHINDDIYRLRLYIISVWRMIHQSMNVLHTDLRVFPRVAHFNPRSLEPTTVRVSLCHCDHRAAVL